MQQEILIVMQTTTRVQTAFRLDTGLLSRMKRKARVTGQSLNAMVESVLNKQFPAEPAWPTIKFPIQISPETKSLTRDFRAFTEEELLQDDRLAYIFKK